MLEKLLVKNIALIDQVEVDFKEGLNILTGETGAGKSMIIDSINLALGSKADKSIIRNNAEYGYIALLFRVMDKQTRDNLKDLDVFIEEDGELLLERRISAGKSVSKVNGELINTKTLKQIGEYVIDIHGQHEHQSLLKVSKHLELLDMFCQKELEPLKEKLASSYNSYKQCEKEVSEMEENHSSLERDLDFAKFEYTEIENARLEISEDEILEKRNRLLSDGQKIALHLQNALNYLGEEQQDSVSSRISKAGYELNNLSNYDKKLEEIAGQINILEETFDDTMYQIRQFVQDMNYDERESQEVYDRLNVINQLKYKYAKKTSTIGEIFDYQKELEEKINKLENYDAILQEKKQELQVHLQDSLNVSKEISRMRREQGDILQEQVQNALLDLHFLQVDFQIQIICKEEFLSKNGTDKVEFLISLNKGIPVNPLGEVASGGELSRIMLAMKYVLANKDQIDTLIFDEIDTGISGKTAWRVSEKMGRLSRTNQIICITHLPQIAAMADCHFVIEKFQEKNLTKTSLRPLDSSEMISEIARLLGTDEITNAVLENAKELKELADKTKEY